MTTVHSATKPRLRAGMRDESEWAELERRYVEIEREAARLEADRADLERLRASWLEQRDST